MTQAGLQLAVVRLGRLTAAGIPCGEALKIIARSGGKAGGPALHLSRAVGRGHRLSAAFAGTGLLKTGQVALLRAGERSGDVASAINLLAGAIGAEAARRKRLVAALAYPAFLLTMAAAIAILMGSAVLPALVYRPTPAHNPPLPTRVLMAASQAAASYGPALLGGTAIVLLALTGLTRRWPPLALARDRALLALPALGPWLLHTNQATVFATVTALLDAGTNSAEALALAEESGDYAGAFRELSLQASTLAQERLDLLTRLAEPMAAVVVAAVAASCLTAMYGPVLGAADLIRGGM